MKDTLIAAGITAGVSLLAFAVVAYAQKNFYQVPVAGKYLPGGQ